MKSAVMRLKNCRGQSLVEFALIVPVLLVFLIGIIEWGCVLWEQAAFTDAIRNACRTAAVMSDWNGNQSGNTTTVKNAVVTNLQTLPAIMKQDIDANIVVELLPNSANIQSIRVSIVDQPYQSVTGLNLIPTPATLSASAEFRYESAL